MKREVEERGLKLSITEGLKRRKEQGNHFLHVSGGEVSEMQQKKGVVVATNFGTLDVHLKTGTNQLGAKEVATRKKCDVRLSLIRKYWVFQKNT